MSWKIKCVKEAILWIIMVVIFFQRDGLTLCLCFEQTTQHFMKDLNRSKYCRCTKCKNCVCGFKSEFETVSLSGLHSFTVYVVFQNAQSDSRGVLTLWMRCYMYWYM